MTNSDFRILSEIVERFQQGLKARNTQIQDVRFLIKPLKKSWVNFHWIGVFNWYWCFFPHWSRDSVSPVCGIFFLQIFFTQFRENLFGSQETFINPALFLEKLILLIHLHFNPVISRPGVAGAVLKTPSSLIDWLSDSSFSSKSSRHLYSKSYELGTWNCSPPSKCHISHVMFHVSHVTCHVSRVTYHMSHVKCHIFLFLQSGWACWWRVCYQRGVPRLVFLHPDEDCISNSDSTKYKLNQRSLR